MKKYLAEFIGTFTLSFVVLLALANGNPPISIPVIAGLTLALFVYTIGSISGSHINPAVTLGLLSIKKISNREAFYYILVQILGAVIAIIVARFIGFRSPLNAGMWSIRLFLAEMLGTVLFAFGIASVVYGKVKDDMSGIVIGGSLLLGILISSLAGAAGILNPVVALAIHSLNLLYLLAPIVGSIIGFQVYKKLEK